MKAINHYLIIKKDKVKPKKVGGLILTEKLDEDNRYLKAKVVSVGESIDFIKENDSIYYDKYAGHGITLNEELYHVITVKDVVIVE